MLISNSSKPRATRSTAHGLLAKRRSSQQNRCQGGVMQCSTLMKTDLECCGVDETIEDAAARMKDRCVGFLPVCQGRTKVLGTLTDRDIVVRVVAAGLNASETKVSEVFSREVISCSPDDDLTVAEALMSKHKKSRILCLDRDETLVGVISLSDVARVETGARSAALLRSVAQREARP
jgi:CBS domain-containing protein